MIPWVRWQQPASPLGHRLTLALVENRKCFLLASISTAKFALWKSLVLDVPVCVAGFRINLTLKVLATRKGDQRLLSLWQYFSPKHSIITRNFWSGDDVPKVKLVAAILPEESTLAFGKREAFSCVQWLSQGQHTFVQKCCKCKCCTFAALLHFFIHSLQSSSSLYCFFIVLQECFFFFSGYLINTADQAVYNARGRLHLCFIQRPWLWRT